MKAPIIGVAGGSGAGKTTFCQRVLDRVGSNRVVYVQHDWYYKDRSHIPLDRRARGFNFDHPDALDNQLLADHLKQVQAGQCVQAPIYDFATHARRPETKRLEPKGAILLEGILVFALDELRDLMDVKVYLDADADLRFIRRLQRDVAERARKVESVVEQYLTTTRPMHFEFVEPTKSRADIIVSTNTGPHAKSSFDAAVEVVAARVEARL